MPIKQNKVNVTKPDAEASASVEAKTSKSDQANQVCTIMLVEGQSYSYQKEKVFKAGQFYAVPFELAKALLAIKNRKGKRVFGQVSKSKLASIKKVADAEEKLALAKQNLDNLDEVEVKPDDVELI
jgi:hypothetical protein